MTLCGTPASLFSNEIWNGVPAGAVSGCLLVLDVQGADLDDDQVARAARGRCTARAAAEPLGIAPEADAEAAELGAGVSGA